MVHGRSTASALRFLVGGGLAGACGQPVSPPMVATIRKHSHHANAMSTQPIALDEVDLTYCDQEPIHIPGSIQPHGVLLTLDPRDLHVVHAGGDTTKLLGQPAIALLGAPAADLFSPAHLARLRDLLGSGRSMIRPVYAFALMVNGATTDVIAHISDELLVLELEPQPMAPIEDALALVQSMVRHVQQAGSPQALYDAVVTEVRSAIGFDRVMIYRFAADGSGAVVAESRGTDIDSFLGYNFPAADIPRQARALYLAN
jgi:chemotaxis family two-component system sensor kinase Cph1